MKRHTPQLKRRSGKIAAAITSLRSKTTIAILVGITLVFSGGIAYALTAQNSLGETIDNSTADTSNTGDTSGDSPTVTDSNTPASKTDDKKPPAKNPEPAKSKETVTAPISTPPASSTPVATAPSPSQPKYLSLYVRPDGPAFTQAASWSASRPSDAAVMTRIANTPSAQWYGDWTPQPTGAVNDLVSRATSAGTVPVLVAYNIPQRDCGLYSAGGAGDSSAYANWIQAFANGIGHRNAIVILEPDALAGMDCLSGADQNTRIAMISDAVARLRATTSASIYIDAGNSGWINSTTMADRLNRANIAQATGFALNVSNFWTTSESNNYGAALAGKLGGKHYVIDTSRNGNGHNGEWCNPSGRALGAAPTLNTGVALADGYLWIKGVGESDGTCNGGPTAGVWWPEYALGLARSAGW
jgi:endoglucanase